jgi:WD40 repeat protein
MSFFRFYFVRVAAAGLLLSAAIAAAQTGTWASPSSGYVYDFSSRSIRSLTGFIGSAVVGLSVADQVDWLSIAPNQSFAMAEQNGSLIWIPNLSAASTSHVLSQVPLARQAFWAADSSQAAILAAGDRLVWLTNFSSGPVPVSTWNLAPPGRGREVVRRGLRQEAVWTLLAADSSADQVLLALHTGESSQLWLASTNVPPQAIPLSGNPLAAAFAQGNGSAFVADAAGHRIVQIQNLASNPIVTTVVSSELYVNDPAAMVVSADGNRLFVADHADNVIRVFDLRGSTDGGLAPIAELPTSTAPISLTAFAPDRFVLNAGGSSDQPVFFLDTGTTPKLSFVPRGQ